jgi:hypothetical protein
MGSSSSRLFDSHTEVASLLVPVLHKQPKLILCTGGLCTSHSEIQQACGNVPFSEQALRKKVSGVRP